MVHINIVKHEVEVDVFYGTGVSYVKIIKKHFIKGIILVSLMIVPLILALGARLVGSELEIENQQ